MCKKKDKQKKTIVFLKKETREHTCPLSTNKHELGEFGGAEIKARKTHSTLDHFSLPKNGKRHAWLTTDGLLLTRVSGK